MLNVVQFRKDLMAIKDHLDNSLKDLELREKEFETMNCMNLDFSKTNLPEFTTIILLDKTFKTSTSNLLKHKGSLLYYIISRQEYKIEDDCIVICLNVESEGFETIINFLKYNKVFNIESINLQRVFDLSDYLSLYSLSDIISNKLPPTLIGFTTNGPYQANYGYNIIGGFEISCVTQDDNDGLTSSTPGWFIFEFNRESFIESIKYRGYTGNTQFSSSNGNNSKLSFSLDGTNFEYLCNLPTFSSSNSTVKFKKVKAKFVKVENTSYVGFSYLQFN